MKKLNFLSALMAFGVLCSPCFASAQDDNWEYDDLYDIAVGEEAYEYEAASLSDNIISSYQLKKLTDDDFASTIAKGAHVIEFGKDWDGKTTVLEPRFIDVAKQLADMANFAKVNIDQSPKTKKQYHIDQTPTIIVYRDGKELDRKSGLMSTDGIKEFVLRALQKK